VTVIWPGQVQSISHFNNLLKRLTENSPLAILLSKLIVRIKRAKSMKKNLHPEYFKEATISCACGATYEIGSTVKSINTELCAACHPFYTGKQKIIDTARRVEKFEARLNKQTNEKGGKKVKKEKRSAQKKAKREEAEKAEA
jgi:large subunit ribosomal protein L31